MKPRVAPAAGERPRALQVEVQVVLGRVADRAVALERGPARSRARPRRPWPWPSRRARSCRDRRPRSKPRPGTRAGGRTRARCARSARWCFTAWNEPTGTPNCRRSCHVVGRHLEHAICQPALLGGDSAHAAVVGGEHSRRRRPAPACPAPRTGGGRRRPTAAATSSTPLRSKRPGRGEDHVGGVGPRHPVLARRDR